MLSAIVLASFSILADQSQPFDVLNFIEQPLQKQLSRFQRNPDALASFSSDGCSGGLSAGWQVVSQVLSPITDKLGASPPWEHCCVAHDRLYWKGAGADGVAMRLIADQQLQACVLATDQQALLQKLDDQQTEPGLVAEIDQQLQAQLRKLMPLVAELMYQAVRPGGLPCSGLPWRWGYGWPQCGVGELYPSFEKD